MHGWRTIRIAALLLFVTTIGTLGSSHPTHAATIRNWTGAVDLNWNTPGNWSPAGVPVNGDSVVIAVEGAHITGVPSDLSLDVLYLGATVVLSGDQLKIGTAITVTKMDTLATLDLAVVLTGNVQASVPPRSTLSFRRAVSPLGTVALNPSGYTLTKTNFGGIYLGGDVIGNGTLAVPTGSIDIFYPLTFGGTITGGTGAEITLTKAADGAPLCGSAPTARVVLSSTAFGSDCLGANGVGSLSGTGSVYALGQFSIGITGETLNANIGTPASATILCCGGGVQTLRGDSPMFSGQFSITGGGLILDGATFPATSRFAAQGHGDFPVTLGGYGNFGTTNMVTATLDLTSVDNKYGFARFPSLQLTADVEVDYDFTSRLPGIGFTQVVLTGPLVLGDPALSLSLNDYTPAAGQALTLITGATSLAGTFHNAADGNRLPEGAVFTVGGFEFKITYKGGAGHDVIITRQGATTPPPQNNKRFLPGLARDN